MKNPYPEFIKKELLPGKGEHWIKIKDERHTYYQEGYDAKEKEDQDLYEALREVWGHLNTGWIANDCVKAERMRSQLEASILSILAKVGG